LGWFKKGENSREQKGEEERKMEEFFLNREE
jgi:hypothetical protein